LKTGIVVFAFGTPAEIPPNKALAISASNEARRYGLEIFTQVDIKPWEGILCTYITEKEGEPPPTWRIAKWAVEQAIKKGLNKLWVFAAAPHRWRCVRDLKMAIKEAGMEERISIKVWEPDKKRSPNKYWFSDKSTQPRTQSWLKWWIPREFLLKYSPLRIFFLYKMIPGNN